jgi:AcrR family transcriptional regulator
MKRPDQELEMARIDLVRRAQIGRDRSARTRAELIAAACGLYAARPLDQVTVDDVVGAADVAKGTFYVHFASLSDLQRIVADELAHEFDELLQPRRLALDDPIERIAAGCGAFVIQALRNPAWGSLVAHSAAAMPSVAGVARKRLKEDIDRAARDGQLNGVTPDLAFDFANGIVLHAMQTASEKRLSPEQAPDVVAGILRAIGVAPAKTAAVARRTTARGQS